MSRQAGAQDETEMTPEMIEAGVRIYQWWESEAFSEWYEKTAMNIDPVTALVREMWLGMQAARRDTATERTG